MALTRLPATAHCARGEKPIRASVYWSQLQISSLAKSESKGRLRDGACILCWPTCWRARLDSRDQLYGHQLWRRWVFKGWRQRMLQKPSRKTSALAAFIAVGYFRPPWLAKRRVTGTTTTGSGGFGYWNFIASAVLGMQREYRPLATLRRAWPVRYAGSWRLYPASAACASVGARYRLKLMQMALSESVNAASYSWRYFHGVVLRTRWAAFSCRGLASG